MSTANVCGGAGNNSITDTDVEDLPVRKFMDDPGIAWKNGKPDFTKANEKYLRERSRRHVAGSLEKLVENLVKTWEMESSHKTNPADWRTVDVEKFKISCNGGKAYSIHDNVEIGNYNILLAGSVLYKATAINHDDSHRLFRGAFRDGFAWELLELLSGPPRVTFIWRHWGTSSGPFGDLPATNENIELFGVTVATVSKKSSDEDFKIESLETFFDPNPMIGKLMGVTTPDTKPGTCPFGAAMQIPTGNNADNASVNELRKSLGGTHF